MLDSEVLLFDSALNEDGVVNRINIYYPSFGDVRAIR